MPVEIIGAIIALVGVVVSVAISYFISQRQANIEVEKLRTELHQAFSVKLFEKRLTYYPELYKALSNFKKIITYQEVDTAELKKLFEDIQEWDSHYSVFFGSRPGKLVYAMQKQIFTLLQSTPQEQREYFQNEETRIAFIKMMTQIELALKAELGVYAYEKPAEVRTPEQFQTYQQVTAFGKENNKEK